MYDIIIIGAGPAGLTSAIYARRAGKSVLILEAKSYGGQIVNAYKIENYPYSPEINGYDFATKLYEQVKFLGAEFKFEKVVKINNLNNEKEVITSNNIYKTKAVIIATGANNRKLGLDRENDFIGKGVSYCATCDGNFYKEKDVAIVGGGDTAVEDAIFLSNICNKVYIIVRKDVFRASKILVDRIKEINNIEIVLNSNVKKLIGESSLSGIEIVNNDGNIRNINVSALFIAIGQVPQNEDFRNLINLDESGYIISDEKCHTNVEGIFVAGDTRTKKLRQLVTATSDGANAAMEAVEYIEK